MVFVFLCLTSLSMIISRFIHIATKGIILFFFMAEGYIYHIFFMYSFVDAYIGFFHVLAIVNSAPMNIEVNVSF